MTQPRIPKRRDANGRSSPAHARRLLARARESHSGAEDALNNFAFLATARSSDAMAEGLGEAFIESATSGQGSASHRQDEITTEEDGGPYVVTEPGEEFATGMDESNILEASREAFPTSSSARSGPGPLVARPERAEGVRGRPASEAANGNGIPPSKPTDGDGAQLRRTDQRRH